MIPLLTGAISGAFSALALAHMGIGGAAIVLSILIFCAVQPFPRGKYD